MSSNSRTSIAYSAFENSKAVEHAVASTFWSNKTSIGFNVFDQRRGAEDKNMTDGEDERL